MSVLGALAAALGRGRRVPRVGFTRLTTKQGPRTYYKGKGAASTGHHTSKGGYTVAEHKLPRYIVPDLSGFKLRPFIATDTVKPTA
ncbi:39S ribosomal L41- mitochondrial-like [Chlorella sorokiniana]|uniref:39S ribosomal L41-mitochondrial-like n=1 Tax=Chlorella sorokiniana TaxID=3076 RepID=A0A2P6TK51_CHLSO|nr:39S ribosomal L41- mitochondrial-like [Chlorella sorokiniana]|eukprot:PRW44460.1 39S ribosomal L41- mitochondrial-like [Chlorella sorokiniana]